jgi:hypothetical protein
MWMRVLPARLASLHSRLTDTPQAAFFAIFAFFLLVRWPFRAEYLVNWDAVQFALAAVDFNIEAHQPHPPGYIGYVAVARLLSMVTGDVPGALTLISLFAGAVAPAVFFLLARRLLHDRHAIAATILFGFSPLLWYYSGVALTYAPEVAMVLVFAWLSHRAVAEGRMTDLLLATLLLALLGAVRQTAMMLTAGIWLYALLAFPWRARIIACGVMGAAVAAWVIPLLWLVGGPEVYLRESAALAALAGARTSIFTAALAGVAQNAVVVIAGLIVGLHVAPAILALAHSRYGNPWKLLARSDRWLLIAWAAPSLVVFLLGHAGQPGYVLIVLPVAFIWLGAAIALIDRAHDVTTRLQANAQAWSPRAPLAGWVAVLLIVSVTAHVTLPRMVYALVSSEAGATAQHTLRLPSPAERQAEHFVDTPGQSPLATAMRQYSIPENDRYWRDVIEYIEGYDPDEVVVLTSIGGPLISGSFRHLGYYLPEYPVHGVGWDLDDRFGHLFESRNGESTYSMRNLQRSRQWLDLREGVHWIVIPDGDLASQLDRSLSRYRVKMESGAVITVVPIREHATLVFESMDEDEARIRAR